MVFRVAGLFFLRVGQGSDIPGSTIQGSGDGTVRSVNMATATTQTIHTSPVQVLYNTNLCCFVLMTAVVLGGAVRGNFVHGWHI